MHRESNKFMQIVKKDFKLQLKSFISNKIVSNNNKNDNKNDNNKINEEIDQSDDPLEKY